MITVSYPPPDFKIIKEQGKELIFDPLRKKWVVLTPEEWVRQNFIAYLIRVKQYPAALVAVEKEMKLGELRKRFDILVYDPHHRPLLMVECKAMEVPLNEKVLEQLLRYNISIPVQYLVITNGSSCFAWKKTGSGAVALDALPEVV